MINPDQKNLVLSNYNIHDINLQPTEGEKIKHVITYLEDVTTLLRKYHEAIQSLESINKDLVDRLDSQSEHLKAHDQHLASHGEHLEILSKNNKDRE